MLKGVKAYLTQESMNIIKNTRCITQIRSIFDSHEATVEKVLPVAGHSHIGSLHGLGFLNFPLEKYGEGRRIINIYCPKRVIWGILFISKGLRT